MRNIISSEGRNHIPEAIPPSKIKFNIAFYDSYGQSGTSLSPFPVSLLKSSQALIFSKLSPSSCTVARIGIVHRILST